VTKQLNKHSLNSLIFILNNVPNWQH